MNHFSYVYLRSDFKVSLVKGSVDQGYSTQIAGILQLKFLSFVTVNSQLKNPIFFTPDSLPATTAVQEARGIWLFLVSSILKS